MRDLVAMFVLLGALGGILLASSRYEVDEYTPIQCGITCTSGMSDMMKEAVMRNREVGRYSIHIPFTMKELYVVQGEKPAKPSWLTGPSEMQPESHRVIWSGI